jgi:hypothetical protein
MSSIRLVLFALLTSMFLACSGGGSGADKIVGKWTVDVDALSEMEEFKKMPEEQRKMALEMAKGMMSSMEFEFTKDTFKVSMMGKSEEGSYTVKSSEGDKVVLSAKGKDGKEEEMTVSANGDKMVMHMGKDQFPLKRK